MDAQDRFLAEVAAQLPLPDDARREVVEELAAHLSDTVADLVAQGRDPHAAETEAIGRLGPPANLAHGLAQARRGRTQMLAGAGAGTWAAVRTGTLGAVLGWLLIVLASIAGTVVARFIAERLGLQVSLSWTPGWNTVLTAAGLSVGGLLAGAAAVRAVARRSWRAPAEVRSVVAATGALALGWFAVVALEQPLNWASVVALLLVPVSFIVGAHFERLRLPGARIVRLALLVGLIVVLAGSLAVAAAGGGGATSYSWSETSHGYEMIALWWQDPASGQASDFPSGESFSGNLGTQTVTVYAASPSVVVKFSDFRLEAWRAEPPGNGWRLVPGQSGPFATAPASVEDTSVSGTLRFNQVPGVDWAQVVLTAIGPDGRRYLLSASGPEQTEFYGSVWSWFAALPR